MENEMIFFLSILVGLVLGFTATPKSVLGELIQASKLQTEINTTIESLNQLKDDVSIKEEQVHQLSQSIDELEDTRLQLLERIEFLKNSDELKALDDIQKQTEKLSKLKQTINTLKGKNHQKFNTSALIELVRSLYFDIYQIELSIKEVSELINNDFIGSDTFGGNELTPNSNKRSM